MINWKAYLIGGLLFAMMAASGYMAYLRTSIDKAEKAAKAAQAQAVVSDATAQAIDRVTLTERRITNEVRYVEREIEALPSGEALVPDDVASAWGNGIDVLRASNPENTDPR
jgi:hypothetical protein